MSSTSPATASVFVPDKSGTLTPVPDDVRRGLTAIAVASFTSIWGTVLLFGYICWRLCVWKQRGADHVSQYVAILLNLVFADLIQGIGFSLSLKWLQNDSITADTAACRMQGWFINAGDVGACFFTLAMAVLLFCDIVLERRIKRYPVFLFVVAGIWILDFFLASIGIAIHGDDFYRRAGLWCWINEKYMDERLALHYIWVLITEFGTITLYTTMFITIWRRLRQLTWDGDDVHLRRRAQSAAYSVVAYPVVYVVCTLPAVVARLSIMAGRKVGNIELSVVGFMLVSNGWLDVILYSTTRRSLITGQTIHDQDTHTLDTFAMCRGEGSVLGVYGASDLGKQIVIDEIGEVSASTSNSWDKDTISRGHASESRTRDFTKELDAIWRPPQHLGGRVRAQPLHWEDLKQAENGRGRQRQSVIEIGTAR